jgi:hypothetical protein
MLKGTAGSLEDPVPVDNQAIVAVFHGGQHLAKVLGSNLFTEMLASFQHCFNSGHNIAAGGKLQHNYKAVLVLEAGNEVNNVGVTRYALHDLHLTQHIIVVILALENLLADDLDSAPATESAVL